MEKLRIFLKENRKKNNMSQGDLATKMGYSTSQFISNIERGVSLPPTYDLPKLAKILNVPLSEIKEAFLHDYLATARRKITLKLGRV
jgi:transcriptional regulator with XRE-family HTH domain